MRTVIYMVRHAESPYSEGTERTRGLTAQGKAKVEEVTEILKQEGIEAVISSPYARAVMTVQGLADHLGVEVELFEDLRERHFSGEDYHIRDDRFMDVIKELFQDPESVLPGGESNRACQRRAIDVLKPVLEKYAGKRVAIGTHGNVMTLMMNHFDPGYGFEFLTQTTKPDIYKMDFEDSKLVRITRLWEEQENESGL